MILDGRVDGAAVDSTVLKWVSSHHTDFSERIRVIETFGPSPIPPWVISSRVPEADRKRLRKLFLQMYEDPMGRSILSGGQMARFVSASDTDYDPIRIMARTAEQVTLEAL